jgi:formylglycine-generating enzyme required for sulfatase activity
MSVLQSVAQVGSLIGATIAILNYFGVKPKAGVMPPSRQWKLFLMLGLVALSLGLSGYGFYRSLHPQIVEQIVEINVPQPLKQDAKSGLEYLRIPAGSFVMGCTTGDPQCHCIPVWKCHFEENPAHRVVLSKGFWMGQTEVTVGAYKHSLGIFGGQMPAAPAFNLNWADDKQPMVNVTWNDARAFCNRDSGRLPSEAEWEYAARGMLDSPQYGNIEGIMWYSGNSNGGAHDVGLKSPNYVGLADMLGNVWEWVNDWYDETYYDHSQLADPKGPESGNERVLRGGSWSNGTNLIRLSDRNRDRPTAFNNIYGFRCVQDY